MSLVFLVMVGACEHQPSGVTRSNDDPPVDSTPPVVDTDTDGPPVDSDSGVPVTVPIPGLRATYFAGYLDPVLEEVEPTVDVDWGDGGPSDVVGSDRFSARWTGALTAEVSGPYTLVVDSDDGVRLWLDDVLVIDDWAGHFVTRNTADVALVAGVPVALRLEYFEIDLAASIRLSWASDALIEEVVPADRFTTEAVPSPLAAPKPPFTNPVVAFDCPDPGVVAAPIGGEDPTEIPFALVCTGGSFPIRTSRGLVSWLDTTAALLPDGRAPWAANGYRDWAPELHWVEDRFVGYYTSVNGGNVLSIGVTSSTVVGPSGVLGPYVDLGVPLVEHPDGVIDASFFEDTDGSRWLLYKVDGNAHGRPTPIFIRELAADGLAFAAGSTAVQILVNDASTWEGGVVEAPWLVRRGSWYYLFYSGNGYDQRYRTGVARSDSLLGPYEKGGDPILANNERWVGPGHGSVVTAGDLDYFVYHAWRNDGTGYPLAGEGRQILVDRIDWVGDWPAISDGTPSRTAQPWPGSP